MNLDRAMKLYYLGLLLVLCLTSQHVTAQCSPTSPCTPLRGGEMFQEPNQVSSSDGRLSTALVVDIGMMDFDWLSVHRRLYNGSYPGPTLRFRAGDTVTLDLINNLQQPDYVASDGPNVFNYPNTTNIHTHGLHISSQVPQDNVFIEISPGNSFTYKYKINQKQPAGTYWYHPHQHGAGYFQVSSGMAGMIVLEDDPGTMTEELNAVSCPENCENDLQFVFQTLQYSYDDDADFAELQRSINDYEGFRFNNVTTESNETLEEWLEDPSNNISYILVNGMIQPHLTIRPGEVKRFRLLNAGGLYTLALQIINTDSKRAACDVKEIAIDGVYLDMPRKIRLERSLIVSGSRVDWLIKCPTAGMFQLQSKFNEEDYRSLGDHPTFNGILMFIDVTGDDVTDMNFPTQLPERPNFLRDLRSVKECEIGGRFTIEVTSTDTINREDFSPNSIRYKAEVGTIQEFHFTNVEYETSHPIHMHINTMQVISYNPYTGPFGVDDGDSAWALFGQNGLECKWQHPAYDANAQITKPENPLKYLGHNEVQSTGNKSTLAYAPIGDRRDTILVPPLGNITVRFVADEYTGEVVVHCHLLGDADQGMLMKLEIVEKGQNMEANITSAGAYPGACFNNFPIYTPKCGGSAPAVREHGFLVLGLVTISLYLLRYMMSV